MRNRKLRNRVVVITGASSGFGRGAAVKFAEAGAHVVLAARRRRLLKDVARECEQHNVEALVVSTDVSEATDVAGLAAKALDRFGRIDVWVNNAGVGAVGEFEETPLEEHEQVIRTNLLGTLYGSYQALQQFHEQGRGVLINVGSFAGKIGAPYLSSYSASKFGVRGLGMALRQELEENGEEGIHVCTIMPVSHDTPFFEHAANYSGKPVRPIPPVYDPQKVVDTIYEVALHPEDEVIVGPSGKISSMAQRIAPGMMEKAMGWRAHKAQTNQTETEGNKSGSVFRPERSGGGVHGGWLEKKRSSKLAKVLSFALPIGMSAAFLALRAREKHSEYEDQAA